MAGHFFVWGNLMSYTQNTGSQGVRKTSDISTTGRPVAIPGIILNQGLLQHSIPWSSLHRFIISLPFFFFLHTAKYFNIKLYLLQPKYWFYSACFVFIHLYYLNYAQNPLKIQTFTLSLNICIKSRMYETIERLGIKN